MLLRIAMGLFGIGIISVIAIFAVTLITGNAPGVWLYLLAMLTPVGLLLGIFFALWSGRQARK
ncbi:hypothetical protein GCM10011591_33540 [Nocardia camponoti]|uniref:Uncharacterized protein n=1 Tax=Nocardia camponoti TaxID=1616106 RepID=A0A917VBC5_9NOCA|nr:hypothetical protein GCM10011591_33540 [Nocardia camponoti]